MPTVEVCMGTLQAADRETLARTRRVQELCRQLARLVSRSREQRRAIDRLLGELETVTRQADRRATARAGVAADPPSSPTAGAL
jgi:hypothetical protein